MLKLDWMRPGVPEVEGAYYPASLQEGMHHNAHHPIVVASAHWGIRMRHDDASVPPWCWIAMFGRATQVLGVVEAAVEGRVIVDRGDGEAVMGILRAGHLPTRCDDFSLHGVWMLQICMCICPA